MRGGEITRSFLVALALAAVSLPARSGANLIARAAFLDGLAGMGAKYLPTVKDQKANQRYQQLQNPLHKLNRSAANQAATAAKLAKGAKPAEKK